MIWDPIWMNSLAPWERTVENEPRTVRRMRASASNDTAKGSWG